MRTNDIDMSDPTTPGGKPVLNGEILDQAKYEAAVNACRQYMPNLDKALPPMDAATLEMWRNWAGCMRSNGVPIEDPQPNAVQPPGVDIPSGTDTTLYIQGVQACSHIVGGAVTVEGYNEPKGSGG